METIYAVLKDEVWDGERWDENYGSFRSEKDAKAQMKKVRDEICRDWEDETIDQDDENGFHAFREGWYDIYHVSLYVLKMKLWDEKELN